MIRSQFRKHQHRLYYAFRWKKKHMKWENISSIISNDNGDNNRIILWPSSLRYYQTTTATATATATTRIETDTDDAKTDSDLETDDAKIDSDSDDAKIDSDSDDAKTDSETKTKPFQSKNCDRNNDNVKEEEEEEEIWYGTELHVHPSTYAHDPLHPLAPYVKHGIKTRWWRKARNANNDSNNENENNQILKTNMDADSDSDSTTTTTTRLSKRDKGGTLNAGSARSFQITFLGTGSGGRPNSVRSASSTILTLGTNINTTYLFDAGEGMQRQLTTFSDLTVRNIYRIFITHMHADHVMGLIGILLQIGLTATSIQKEHIQKLHQQSQSQNINMNMNINMNIHQSTTTTNNNKSKRNQRKKQTQNQEKHQHQHKQQQQQIVPKTIHLYGPPGLYHFVNSNLELTKSYLGSAMILIIHELIGGTISNQSTSQHGNNYSHPYSPNNKRIQYKSIPRNKDGTWTILQGNNYSNNNHNNNQNNHNHNNHNKKQNNDYSQTQYEEPGITIHAGEISHTNDMQTFGYVVKEPTPKHIINVQKAIQLGINPGPKYRKLKDGISVPSDKDPSILIHPHQVTDTQKSTQPRSFAILGDTSGSYSHGIKKLCQHVDVLVHEATLHTSQESEAKFRGHSTARMAGLFAKDVHAKVLILNHLSLRNKTQTQLDDLVRCASEAVHPTTTTQSKQEYTCHVAAAYDFMQLSVPRGGFDKYL